MPVDKWIAPRGEVIFQAFSVSRIYKFCSLVLPRSLAGFALSFGCGEHCWLSLKGKI